MEPAPTSAPRPDVLLDDWKPEPYAQRASQHVSFGQFVQRALMHLIVGGSSGWAIGWGVERMTHTRLPLKTVFSTAGTLLGGFITWRRDEKSRLEADTILKEYRTLPGLLRSNEEVAADNHVLRQMVHFQQGGHRPATQVAATGSQHDGAVEAAEAALAK